MINLTEKKKQTFANPLSYIIIVGGTLGIGFLAGILSGSNAGYTGYTRPPLTPPDAVFAIVWPILYFLIGNSLFVMLNTDTQKAGIIKKAAIILWIAQMILNIAWPFIFFTADLKTVSLILITVLDAAVIGLTILNFMYSKPAAWLIVPYAAWILFATYLNLFIALYN